MNPPPYYAVQPTTTESAVYEVPIYVVQPTITVSAVSPLPVHPLIHQALAHPVLFPRYLMTRDQSTMIQCIPQTLSLQLIPQLRVGSTSQLMSSHAMGALLSTPSSDPPVSAKQPFRLLNGPPVFVHSSTAPSANSSLETLSLHVQPHTRPRTAQHSSMVMHPLQAPCTSGPPLKLLAPVRNWTALHHSSLPLHPSGIILLSTDNTPHRLIADARNVALPQLSLPINGATTATSNPL